MNHLSTSKENLIQRLASRNLDFFAIYKESGRLSHPLRSLPSFEVFWGGLSTGVLESYFRESLFQGEEDGRVHMEQAEVYSISMDYGLSFSVENMIQNSPKGGFSCMNFNN